MAIKVCTVKGIGRRGIPQQVLVEASSLLEAAAQGVEQFLGSNSQLCDDIVVTVYEPGRTYEVRPSQLIGWLTRHDPNERSSVADLKERVTRLIRELPGRPKKPSA